MSTLPNQLLEKSQFYLAQLDKELAKYPQLRQLEQTTGIPKTYAIIALSSVIFVLIFFNVAASFLTTAIGFGYPALASIKALQSKDKADDCQWMTYWIVFSFFNVLEFFSDILLFWVPLYYVIKTTIIFYLALPQFRGAETVYYKVILPFVAPATTSASKELPKESSKDQ